jgi:hypothetical protein
MDWTHFSVNREIIRGRAVTASPIIVGKYTRAVPVKAFFMPRFILVGSSCIFENTGKVTRHNISAGEEISCKDFARVKKPTSLAENNFPITREYPLLNAVWSKLENNRLEPNPNISLRAFTFNISDGRHEWKNQ